MKVNLIFLAIFINITVCYCQPFQFQVTLSGNYEPSPITVGQNSELTLTFCNLTFGTLPQNPIPAGGLYILVNFGDGYVRTNTAPFDRDDPSDPNDVLAASLFNWSSTPSGGWYGISNTAISSNSILCGKIIIQVTGTSMNNNASSNFTASIIAPNSDSTPSDNTGSARLQVNSVLPIELTSFSVINSKCGDIKLDWETASERNNDYFEILRSYNGNEFIPLGRVKGTNTDSRFPTSYSFADNFDLKDNQKYYYRLKQVDMDGRSKLFKIISTENNCPEKIPSLSISPNPSIDKVNLNLLGFKNPTDVKFNILNHKGSLVRTITVNSGSSFELFLNDLPSGVYHLKSIESGITINRMFIKIQ